MTKRSIYHDRMLRRLNVLVLASLSFTLFACGNTSDVALIDEVRDAVAFRAVGETTVSVMAPDGAPLDIDREPAGTVDWPERNTIIGQDWSRTTTGRSSGSDRAELKVVKLDGSVVREITLSYGGDWLPRWSPNGLQLVYETNRDGNSEVYVVDADGRNTRNLTNHEANDLWPTWSRDGHLVAFSSSRSGSDEIFVQPLVGEASPTGRQGHPVPWAR